MFILSFSHQFFPRPLQVGLGTSLCVPWDPRYCTDHIGGLCPFSRIFLLYLEVDLRVTTIYLSPFSVLGTSFPMQRPSVKVPGKNE